MSTAPSFSIVAVEWVEADISVLQYWWTTRKSPPYLVGECEKDWGGPFVDDEEAVNAFMKHFGLEGAVPFEVIDRTELQEQQQFWTEMSRAVTIKVAMPLDEFSERATLESPATAENKELRSSLKTPVLIKAAPEEADILLLAFSPSRQSLKSTLKREEGLVTFELPVHIRFRSPLDLSSAELLERLTVNASLGEHYPDMQIEVLPRGE